MINPSECYNQHRSQSGIEVISDGSYTVRTYSGTVADPWRVISTTTVPDAYRRWIDAEMHDVVTPNFLRIRRKGGIVNSPMERSVVSNERNGGSLYQSMINRSATSPYTFSGTRRTGTAAFGRSAAGVQVWALPSQPGLSDLNSRINQAVTDMWSKVSVKQNDTIASVGEMRETIGSLVGLFKKVIELYRDLRRARLDLVYRKNFSPKALAELYLYYRYALRPLVFEAQSYVDVLVNKTILKRQTFRSYRTYDVPMQQTNNAVLYDSPATFRAYGTQYATRHVEIRGGVLCTLDVTNNLGRWGITEPIEGIWELVPFSFIIDWFFNIGKWIAMWTPNFGISTLASWIVVTDMTTLSATVTSGVNYGSYNYENICQISGNYTKTIVNKYRIPDPTRPTLPMWQVNLDWLKILDIGTILNQLVECKLGLSIFMDGRDPNFQKRKYGFRK